MPGFVAPDTTALSTDAIGVMSAVTVSNDDFNAYLGICNLPIAPGTAQGLPIMARIVHRIDSCDATASLP